MMYFKNLAMYISTNVKSGFTFITQVFFRIWGIEWFVEFWRKESRANQLWIPQDSEYNNNQRWIKKHFAKNERQNIIMFKSENVLKPEVIRKVSLIIFRRKGTLESQISVCLSVCQPCQMPISYHAPIA